MQESDAHHEMHRRSPSGDCLGGAFFYGSGDFCEKSLHFSLKLPQKPSKKQMRRIKPIDKSGEMYYNV
jgi:hypothetical protein